MRKGQEGIQSVPEPTLRRLPVYYQYVKNQRAEKTHISCTQIAEALGQKPIQVRKDLEITGAIGKPRLGYPVTDLINNLEQFLGYRRVDNAFLIGAGHLGLALLGYEGFKEKGLNIVAAFDTDLQKVGKRFHGKEILHIDKFTTLVKRMKIPIGILTVPAHEAQKTADMMVKAGIKAIWSFVPVHIHVPEEIIVLHENLGSSLVVLSNKLTMKLAHKEEA